MIISRTRGCGPFGRWRFAHDQRGAAALEFAIVGLPLLALIYSILEVSVDYFLYTQLDTTLVKAVGEIRSGTVQIRQMNREDFRNQVVCPRLAGFNCEKILVNVTSIKSWQIGSNIWTPQTVDPGTQKWCPGPSGAAVMVQVAYPVPLASMIWTGAAYSTNGTRYYLSASGLRNEPFGVPYTDPDGC